MAGDDDDTSPDIDTENDADQGEISSTTDDDLAAHSNRQISLDSSWLTGAYYDRLTQTLYLATDAGRQYTLFGVPPDVFLSFISAPSPGQFFNSQMKGKY
jgi:hypothetical protein